MPPVKILRSSYVPGLPHVCKCTQLGFSMVQLFMTICVRDEHDFPLLSKWQRNRFHKGLVSGHLQMFVCKCGFYLYLRCILYTYKQNYINIHTNLFSDFPALSGLSKGRWAVYCKFGQNQCTNLLAWFEQGVSKFHNNIYHISCFPLFNDNNGTCKSHMFGQTQLHYCLAWTHWDPYVYRSLIDQFNTVWKFSSFVIELNGPDSRTMLISWRVHLHQFPHFSPPARWGLLDFIRVVLLLLLG